MGILIIWILLCLEIATLPRRSTWWTSCLSVWRRDRLPAVVDPDHVAPIPGELSDALRQRTRSPSARQPPAASSSQAFWLRCIPLGAGPFTHRSESGGRHSGHPRKAEDEAGTTRCAEL